MRATVPYLQEKFDLFNSLYFGGKLERIPLETGNAASYLGVCTFKSRRIPFRGVEHYGFKIRISTRLDLPEPEILISSSRIFSLSLRALQRVMRWTRNLNV